MYQFNNTVTAIRHGVIYHDIYAVYFHEEHYVVAVHWSSYLTTNVTNSVGSAFLMLAQQAYKADEKRGIPQFWESKKVSTSDRRFADSWC